MDSLDIYIKYSDSIRIKKEIRNEFSNKAFEILSNRNDSLSRKKIFRIAQNYSELKNDKEFYKITRFLISNTNSKLEKKLLAKTYNLIANKYIDVGRNDSAFIFLIKSEKIFKTLNDSISFGKNYLEKAYVQFNESDYFGCEQSSSFALSYIKNTDDYKNIYNAYTYIGISSNELKNYNNALTYHFKALDIATEHKFNNELHLLSRTQNNIGVVYQNLNEHNNALSYFKLGINEKNLVKDSPDLYSMLLDNYAYSKFKINDFKELPKLFLNSIEISKNNGFIKGLFLNKIHLSEYYYYINDSINSIKYAQEALSTSKLTKISGDILASLKQLSIVEKVNSAKYSKEYIKISDSILVAERNSLDRFARLQYETEELRQENFNIIEQNSIVLNFLLAIVLFSGLLFFIRYQRLRERTVELKQSQNIANEEIYRLIISHQNKLEEGRDYEKQRLSKELHDGVLGRLFGLRLNLDGLNSFDDKIAKEERLKCLNELQIIEQDLREISHELSRENLELINNFVAIINSLVEQQIKINTAKTQLIIAEDIIWDEISNVVKINIYRIVQEGFQNINKHANANNILVHLRKDKYGNLLFNVEDDGVGIDTDSKKNDGIGFKNIISRVQSCQGEIEIKSETGKGSKLIITFPPNKETPNSIQ
ncbi:sensor histidine kinase [Flavobacterium sp.]|uniref:ATP-binding protein n=1 Tax=Flavobacterium sp. TaxID=239 RepID=UPI003752D48F